MQIATMHFIFVLWASYAFIFVLFKQSRSNETVDFCEGFELGQSD